MILTRAPLLTRPLADFEQSYFFYQKRLNERLTMPFITSVYFKPDTPALIDWNMKVKDRKGTVAKELGVYNGKASTAWDDELAVGDGLSKHDKAVELLLKDAVMRVSDDAEIIPEEDRAPPEALAPRVSEADIKGDQTRLDRAMERTLYLVVRKAGRKKDVWEFPAAGLSTEENLHEVSFVPSLPTLPYSPPPLSLPHASIFDIYADIRNRLRREFSTTRRAST